MLPLFQEEGLRKGGEPKYAHLSMELHVFIEVFAPVPEAYLRMAHAMEEVKKFLFPVSMTLFGCICLAAVHLELVYWHVHVDFTLAASNNHFFCH